MTTFNRSLPLVLVLLAACAAPDSDDASAGAAAISSSSGDSALGEALEPNEGALAQQIAEAATTQLSQAQDKSADKLARRAAHGKAHGCVTGSFAVNADIPADLRVGTFQPGKRYDAWVRFSNGSNQDDRGGDARGMAVKLLGVEGTRLLGGESPNTRTHDIVLTNNSRFFLTNLTDYVKFMKTATDKGNPISFFISFNIFDLHLREAFIAKEFTSQPITSPLTSRYWSATPYKLGPQAVKYSMVPCGVAGADTTGKHPDDANYLGKALKSELSGSGGACFNFMVQRRSAPTDMPVEDSTIAWDEKRSPFITIAQLSIPDQTFDSAERQSFCESLSFTPWHGTEQHRPLGSINRARKVVYEVTSTLRHRLNGVPRVEPTSLSVPH